jgi:hypothetical protein
MAKRKCKIPAATKKKLTAERWKRWRSKRLKEVETVFSQIIPAKITSSLTFEELEEQWKRDCPDEAEASKNDRKQYLRHIFDYAVEFLEYADLINELGTWEVGSSIERAVSHKIYEAFETEIYRIYPQLLADYKEQKKRDGTHSIYRQG